MANPKRLIWLSLPVITEVIHYLLRDDFTDTRAAGSVNGTPATPGPGTRVEAGDANVIDSGAYAWAQWVSNQNYLMYQANPITREFGRMIIFRLKINNGSQYYFGLDNNTTIDASTLGEVKFRCQGTNIPTRLILNDNYNVNTAEMYPTGSDHQLIAFVLKSVGTYWFAKWSISSVWKMLVPWAPSGNNTPLYVYWANFPNNTADSDGAIDFIRVPKTLFIVPIDVYDTFTRTNGALGTTETSGPDGQHVNPRTYLGDATWAVATNKAVCTPATLGIDLIVNGAFAADINWTKGTNWTIASGVATKAAGTAANLTQTVEPLTVGKWYTVTYTITRTAGTLNTLIGAFVGPERVANGTYTDVMRADTTTFGFAADASFAGTVDDVSAKELTLTELISPVQSSTANIVASIALTITAGIKCGLVIRLDSEVTPLNFIVIGYDGARVRMGKCVAGTYTNLINAAATYAVNANLVVIADESSVSVYYANAVVGTMQTVSDAGILTNTKHSPMSTGAGAQLDNLLIMARGNGGEYSQLNRYTKNS